MSGQTGSASLTQPPIGIGGASVLLWLRPDRPRAEARAYWAGPHSQIVARSPGMLEYRQHHFSLESRGLWPASDGVETAIPAEGPADGMPEVYFEHAWSPLLSARQNRLAHEDERNVFSRTILYATGPGGARWFHSGAGERVGARTAILLRRRPGVGFRTFRRFVSGVLGPALSAAEGTLELRTQAFLPWLRRLWDTPGVAHENPPEARFHASIVLGAADFEALGRVLSSAPVASLGGALREMCSAIHAYDVEDTYVFRRDGRPTLPQLKPERKPRLDPVKRSVPPAPARAKRSRSERPFPPARPIPLSGSNAEDVVDDAEGRLLCGVEGGRILRVDPERRIEETVADTGGRPLGLEALADGRLLVCDAHMGLLRVEPDSGEVETLVRFVDGIPLRFCSNAAAASDGTIYFTESTSRYDFEQYLGALFEHRPSGRLLRRDADGTVEVIRSELDFANGVTLTEDQSALIFAETGACRLTRLHLTGPSAGRSEAIADNLPGYPDNLSRVRDGRFWVALPNPRDPMLDRLATSPTLLRKLLWRLPDRLMPEGTPTTWAMAFDESGSLVADLQEDRADFHMATGVAERDGRLYLASPERSALLALDLRGSWAS